MREPHRDGWAGRAVLATGGIVAVLALLGGCSDDGASTPKARDPFIKETVEGSDLVRLRMEPRAVERIELRLAEAGGPLTVNGRSFAGSLPYGALLYHPDGSAFVYMNPEPNVYVRHPVEVVEIVDGVVRYSAGPAQGHGMVTDGAAELWGAEFGVGK